MKLLSLFVVIASGLISIQSYGDNLNRFECSSNNEQRASNLLVFAVGNYFSAEITLDENRKIQMTAVREVLDAKSAQKNYYAKNLAKDPLNLDWSKVKSVVVFTIGNYSDDASGAVAINFLNDKYESVAKGMWLRSGGPLKCDL